MSGFREKITLSMNAGVGAATDVVFERLPRAAIKASDYDFFRKSGTTSRAQY